MGPMILDIGVMPPGASGVPDRVFGALLMIRTTCRHACPVILIATAMLGSVRADGFDAVGFRGFFRDLGVSLGPGYHHPPCLPHLRQHYQMAVSGHPLPASQLAPLHLLNSKCMQASRYVPLADEGCFTSAESYSLPLHPLPSPASPSEARGLEAGELTPLPITTTSPAPSGPSCEDPMQRIPSPFSMPRNFDNRSEGEPSAARPGQSQVLDRESTRGPAAFDSPFERYSPNAPGPDASFPDLSPRRQPVEDLPRDAARTESPSRADQPSGAQAPSQESTLYDGSQTFDEVEIREDLTPLDGSSRPPKN